ncbi:shikimate kinase [Agromyces seonyuensis]|uniref:Shikimate kinase n=1 Tax=Agromyces seonyuensis TaxID=2662446 RepID=A0A6I4NW91_9MICO|nr:shikimate kinase [Agromyces seonyuensis]MWB98401.1 shikimate kinase [Agromyces seonyuensis]
MSAERPVVLIGPMGAGKTAVGKRLATKLGLPFRDTDEAIVAAHGPIEAIFAEHGEPWFREREAEAVAEALAAGGVIAPGGGAVLHDGTAAGLREHDAVVVLLEVDRETVAARLVGGRRPLLAGGGIAEWERIMEARRPRYAEVATLRIDTSGRSVEAIVAELVGRLRPAQPGSSTGSEGN